IRRAPLDRRAPCGWPVIDGPATTMTGRTLSARSRQRTRDTQNVLRSASWLGQKESGGGTALLLHGDDSMRSGAGGEGRAGDGREHAREQVDGERGDVVVAAICDVEQTTKRKHRDALWRVADGEGRAGDGRQRTGRGIDGIRGDIVGDEVGRVEKFSQGIQIHREGFVAGGVWRAVDFGESSTSGDREYVDKAGLVGGVEEVAGGRSDQSSGEEGGERRTGDGGQCAGGRVDRKPFQIAACAGQGRNIEKQAHRVSGEAIGREIYRNRRSNGRESAGAHAHGEGGDAVRARIRRIEERERWV